MVVGGGGGKRWVVVGVVYVVVEMRLCLNMVCLKHVKFMEVK